VLTSSPANQLANLNGTAKRLRRDVESVPPGISIAPNSVVMITVGCDECGARFALAHHPAFQDIRLSEKQAIWLKQQFVWDHIQEKKHAGSIRLPGVLEIKPVPTLR
jgi:hypothetical protein